uniref:ethanolamine-phosphate cytidylyltransferase n=1 Tax=Opuntia streptacantha TaxID=393608 RepID=A0A7C9EJM1_OPUST
MGSEERDENAELKLRFLAKCVVAGLALGISIWGIHAAGVSETLEMWVRRKKKKPIRVYMDGCFDMMHYGHCNALRQARALGDQLVVGVVSDDEITANKGPPVTPLHERSLPSPPPKGVFSSLI